MAAAAVAVGVGQAEAATVVSYDLTMRYEGTTYTDLTVIDYGSNGDDWQDYYFESLVAETTSIALPTLRDGLKIGAEVVFSALLTVPDDPYNYDSWPGAFDNGGRAIRCEIAGTDCVTGLTATFPEQNIGFGEYRSMSRRQCGRQILLHLQHEQLVVTFAGLGQNPFFQQDRDVLHFVV